MSGELSAEETERLTGSLAWHFDCHAEFPTGSYKSLGIQNALLIVAQIIAARVAAVEAERGDLVAEVLRMTASRDHARAKVEAAESRARDLEAENARLRALLAEDVALLEELDAAWGGAGGAGS